jgi:hypothetical protein
VTEYAKHHDRQVELLAPANAVGHHRWIAKQGTQAARCDVFETSGSQLVNRFSADVAGDDRRVGARKQGFGIAAIAAADVENPLTQCVDLADNDGQARRVRPRVAPVIQPAGKILVVVLRDRDWRNHSLPSLRPSTRRAVLLPEPSRPPPMRKCASLGVPAQAQSPFSISVRKVVMNWSVIPGCLPVIRLPSMTRSTVPSGP